MNIKNGFQGSGLWPLNVNWVKDNKQRIKLKNETNLQKFERILQKRMTSTKQGFQGMVKECAYLSVDLPSKSPPSISEIQNSLDQLTGHVKAHLKDSSEIQKEKKLDKLGDSHGIPKILNSNERLERLTNHLQKEKEENLEPETQSQPLPVSEEEATSRKRKGQTRRRKRGQETDPIEEESETSVNNSLLTKPIQKKL